MRNKGSFFEYSLRIKVEGFEQEKLLTECLRKGISIRDIHIASDIEMSLTLMEWDYQEFIRTAKNRYQITVIREIGYKPTIRKTFRKKSTIAGLILFVLLMFYQSTFVSEIRIYGYEKFTESQVRDSLKEAGLYEGCSKNVDLAKVKLHLYQDLDNIAWVGVKYIGNLAEVTIVEGTQTPKPVDKSKPCDIVADKEGYVERTIAREGKVNAMPGTFVKKGDVLISGIIPLKSTAYGTPEAELAERYVHASGEVYARIPYRLTYYQERYKYLKEATGNNVYGIHLDIGGLKINTAKIFYDYDNSVYSERVLFHTVHPIPMTLGFARIEEVEVTKQERSKSDIEKAANMQVRLAMKEKIPENAQILNKSLKFSTEENIIGVAIMVEALEKIGEEKEIVIGNPTDRRTEDQN
jgi:Putative stage IV sporulation protein YqfD.